MLLRYVHTLTFNLGLIAVTLISLDYEGNVNRINHSITQRDSFFSIDVDQVDEWYDCLKIFINMLYEEAVYFKTTPGLDFFLSSDETVKQEYRSNQIQYHFR